MPSACLPPASIQQIWDNEYLAFSLCPAATQGLTTPHQGSSQTLWGRGVEAQDLELESSGFGWLTSSVNVSKFLLSFLICKMQMIPTSRECCGDQKRSRVLH